MKKLSGLLLAGALVCGQVNAVVDAFKSPDILIDSKLDYDWSSVLVSKIRLLLKNYKKPDPFSGKFPNTIIVSESLLENYFPKESKDLLRDFGEAVGLSIVSSRTNISMEGFTYDLKGFKTDLKATEVLADGLVMSTDFSASEVGLSADKLSFSIIIPNYRSPVPATLFKVDIVKPVIRAYEDKLINFFTKIKIQDSKDFYQLKIQKANFDQMANGLISHPERIVLEYEKIIIPELSVKIGSKTIHFSPEKIERFIKENHDAIKGILLAQAASSLRANTKEAAFNVLEHYKLNKEYWLSGKSIQSQFKIGNLSSSTSGENIEINMPADFCTTKKFDLLKKECIHSKVTQTADSRISKNLHNTSVAVMKDMMETGNTNFVASISEDYLNKLLVTTYDQGLWKKALDEAGVDLGPNKVIMKLDKLGDSGTLLMDVIYKPTMVEKVITGSKVIRFPLVLDVSVRIEKRDGEPFVIIRVNDVDTSDATMIYGRPVENLISTIKDVPRLKKKVAKAIRSRLNVIKEKDIVELHYPEFKGLGLDKVEFLSDGNGRMNAIMRLEDLIEDLGAES